MKKITKNIYEWLDAAVLSLIVVVLIFTFIISVVGVEGASMENTLHTKDRLIISRTPYEPKYGDIVVVSRNYSNDENKKNDNSLYSDDTPIIKRVIATEGQTVEIHDGTVYVDGKPLDEPYAKNETERAQVSFPLTVEKGKVFLLGDNRKNSKDSRYTDIGQVDRRYILGKAFVRIFPFDKIGTP